MSKLSEIRAWISTAQNRMNGTEIPPDWEPCRIEKGLIQFPVPSTFSAEEVNRFYQSQYRQVQASGLNEKRGKIYKKLIRETTHAYNAVHRNHRPYGTIYDLQKPLAHLAKALKLAAETRAFDDAHPVHWSEVYPLESMTKTDRSPDEHWIDFKIASLRPCLFLCIEILRKIFPDCNDIWDECITYLGMKSWVLQFSLDTVEVLNKTKKAPPPMTRDIIQPKDCRN